MDQKTKDLIMDLVDLFKSFIAFFVDAEKSAEIEADIKYIFGIE